MEGRRIWSLNTAGVVGQATNAVEAANVIVVGQATNNGMNFCRHEYTN